LFYSNGLNKQFTLRKNERLKSRKLIEKLFSEGRRFVVSPFRVFYLFVKPEAGKTSNLLRTGVAAGSKSFKKAVDRNRIKRLTREAYRLQKKELVAAISGSKQALLVFFVYTGTALPEFSVVNEKMAVVLNKLKTIVDESIASDN
jgi:ribonuclease P protein component